MKLVRYGNPGKEKPGLIDANGQLRDLSSVVKDIGPDQLGDAARLVGPVGVDGHGLGRVIDLSCSPVGLLGGTQAGVLIVFLQLTSTALFRLL